MFKVYNKTRPPIRPERRHTTATGVLTPSQENSLGPLSSPATHPIEHANTEPQPPRHDLEGAITVEVPLPPITANQSPQLPAEQRASKQGIFLGRILKFRRRRHHPLTEQAYKKTVWGNLKAIVFSSWVNVLLVFVPVVLCSFDLLIKQGIAVRAANVNATVVFSMNCVAVVPLAAVISDLKITDFSCSVSPPRKSRSAQGRL